MSASTGQSRVSSRVGTGSNRRVINRSGRKSRQSQLSALTNKSRRENTLDLDDLQTQNERQHTADLDFGTADIYSEQGWDTDLEEEEHHEDKGKAIDPSQEIYVESCKANNVIPASYFLRHLHDSYLDMRHHGLGTDGVRPLAAALTSNTYVLGLNLMDNWLDNESGQYICDMLKENCYITHLDLSDNQLGLEFAEQFVGVASSNVTLTHVSVSGNLFDDRAAVFWAETIMSTSRIEYLNLSKNKFGESAGIALGPAIAENSSLRVLDLSWNNIRRKGAVGIAQGLKQNVLIQVLNLSWNGLALEGAKALCEALKVNSTVEKLDLTNNRFTTEAAVIFSKCLVTNEMLKVLKMGQNPMQSAGCYGICAAVLRNPNSAIKHLDFTDILVNNDFMELYKNKLQVQFPELTVHHGGDGVPAKPKSHLHPVIKICNYAERHGVRLTDLFQFADPERRMKVTQEEFMKGMQTLGIKLTTAEFEQVIDDLDPNHTGEVNYNELILGRTEFEIKDKKVSNDDRMSRSRVEQMWIK